MKQLSPSIHRALFVVMIAIAAPVRASHICGTELYYSHLAGDSYSLELHVYSDLSLLPDTQWVDTDDGNMVPVAIVNVSMLESFCCSYRHIYMGEHDFPLAGLYLMKAQVYSRSASLINIMDPSTTPVCVTTQLAINSVIGPNTSVRFNTPQTNAYFVGGGVFVHDTQPIDADGDSLTFELIAPTGSGCIPIYPYDYPHEVSPAPDTSWIDPATGVFTWLQPTYLGKYVIAIRCWEWRNGIQFSSVVRDMNLCIYATTDVAEEGAQTFEVLPGEMPGTITVITPDASEREVRILDGSGRQVAVAVIHDQRNTMDLGHLTAGAYVACVQARGASPHALRFVLLDR